MISLSEIVCVVVVNVDFVDVAAVQENEDDISREIIATVSTLQEVEEETVECHRECVSEVSVQTYLIPTHN